jgi:hypothetical protein
MVIEMLAESFLHHGKWSETERLLHDRLNDDTPIGKQGLETIHDLAKLLFAKKVFKAAEIWGHRAASGRKVTLGKRHVLCYLSVNVLAQIYQAQGLLSAAEAYKEVLPPGIEGIFSLKSQTDQRMHRD